MIVSYVVPTGVDEGEPDVHSLELVKSMKTFIADRLPHYMVRGR